MISYSEIRVRNEIKEPALELLIIIRQKLVD